MVYCAHHRTLPVVGLCTSPIFTRRRSLHVADLFALSHLISLLFGCNDLRSPVVVEIWSDFGFCGVVFKSLVVDAVIFLGFVVNL